MPQPQVARVGAAFQEQKAERGKEQRLGLLANEKVQQHRQTGEQQAAQEKGINECHVKYS